MNGGTSLGLALPHREGKIATQGWERALVSPVGLEDGLRQQRSLCISEKTPRGPNGKGWQTVAHTPGRCLIILSQLADETNFTAAESLFHSFSPFPWFPSSSQQSPITTPLLPFVISILGINGRNTRRLCSRSDAWAAGCPWSCHSRFWSLCCWAWIPVIFNSLPPGVFALVQIKCKFIHYAASLPPACQSALGSTSTSHQWNLSMWEII